MPRAAGVMTTCTVASAAVLLAACRNGTAPERPGVLFISSTVSIAADGQPFTYQIVIDGLPPIATASDDIESTFRVGPLPSGDHVVTLRQLAPACTSGNDSRKVNLTPGDTVHVDFSVHCARTTGDVTITSTTTGADVDPDGYVLTLDGSISRSISRAGTRTFLRLAAGTHLLAVTEVEDNCSIAAPTSSQFVVAPGQTTAITVSVVCARIPTGTLGFTALDPAGDTLPNGAVTLAPAIDLVRLEGRYTAGWLILTAHFAQPISPPTSQTANALRGFIDLDVDENPSTGTAPGINRYGGGIVQGVDYEISFATGTSDPTIAALLDAGGAFAFVSSAYAGDSVVLKVPLRKIGADDGNFTLTAVIGNVDRPSDLVPNAGLILGRAPASAVSIRERGSASLGSPVRRLAAITRARLAGDKAAGTARAGVRAWDDR